MGRPPDAEFLDRPAARVAALLVALAAVAGLAWIHRDDLVAGDAERAMAAEDRAFADCYAKRAQDIDAMAAEGTVNAEQATLFKSRAEAMCRDATGGNPTPSPPGL